jgi:hypothetical protein
VKKLFVLALFSSLLYSEVEIGARLLNLQNAEGDGISLKVGVMERGYITGSINRAYQETTLKDDGGESSWEEFQFYRIGFKYILSSFLKDSIRLHVESGAEYISDSTEMADEDFYGSYTLLGLDFRVEQLPELIISFQFGTSGKGGEAENSVGEPDFGHGFNSIVELSYQF